MNLSIYELTERFNKVAEMLIDEDCDQSVIDTLESLDMAIEEKADNYARLIRNQKSTSKGISEEIKRLQQRKKFVDNSVERMEKGLYNSMVSIGKTKFKTDLFSFNIQKNPPKLEYESEELVPKDFKKIKVEIDKTALKKAILSGLEIDGVSVTRSEGVRIR
ncbi:siphovirus Gp157 family protein [Enterococcus sp. AZ102]|uniref:siphovirus Gp157 family protein n=1 Tax=Enterococcus sp. AZ102 TaxID=2774865 RepID=UPI003F228505